MSIGECCVQSEILYACAYGCAAAEHFGSCISVVNEKIKLLGDFNRIFVRPGGDMPRVLEDIDAAQRRRDPLGIPRVKAIELFPDVAQTLVDEFVEAGYGLHEYSFFALTELKPVARDHRVVRIPDTGEYMRWYEQLARTYDDFDEDWWVLAQSQMPEYVAAFKPYWLFVDHAQVGYLHCAEAEEFTCVHDVNISEQYRGKGDGLEIVYKAIQDKRRPVVLRASRSLERFYGKIGFEFAWKQTAINI